MAIIRSSIGQIVVTPNTMIHGARTTYNQQTLGSLHAQSSPDNYRNWHIEPAGEYAAQYADNGDFVGPSILESQEEFVDQESIRRRIVDLSNAINVLRRKQMELRESGAMLRQEALKCENLMAEGEEELAKCIEMEENHQTKVLKLERLLWKQQLIAQREEEERLTRQQYSHHHHQKLLNEDESKGANGVWNRTEIPIVVNSRPITWTLIKDNSVIHNKQTFTSTLNSAEEIHPSSARHNDKILKQPSLLINENAMNSTSSVQTEPCLDTKHKEQIQNVTGRLDSAENIRYERIPRTPIEQHTVSIDNGSKIIKEIIPQGNNTETSNIMRIQN